MDILKELFGGCDELQINKTLFGADVGHDIALDHALSSRENLPHPLPILPEPRPHATPPHLLRSHSLDGLHSTPSSAVSEERDILGLGRSFRPQSAFPQLTKSSNHDWHHVPPEMPMYLLQEDEGNEEEIMRLLGTTGQPLTPPALGASQAAPDGYVTESPPTSTQTRVLPTTSCDHLAAPPTSYGHPLAPPTSYSTPVAPPTSYGHSLAPPTSYSSPLAPPTSVTGRTINGLSTGETCVKVGVAPDCAAQGGEHRVGVALQSPGSPVAGGEPGSQPLVCGLSQETLTTDETLSKGPGLHEDILAKAASLIPVEFHQLVNEVSNQISDPVEGQSSNLFRAILLEMSKLDRSVEATPTNSFSQEEIARSVNETVFTLDDAPLCSAVASVGCQVATRPIPGSIHVGGVDATHLRMEPSSASSHVTSTSSHVTGTSSHVTGTSSRVTGISSHMTSTSSLMTGTNSHVTGTNSHVTGTSSVSNDPISACHQAGARHWPSPSHARMVNEGTQTAHHLSPKCGQSVQNGCPATKSAASTVNVSSTESGAGLQGIQRKPLQVSQRRVLRSQSAPVVQSTTHSSPPSTRPSAAMQLPSAFSSSSSSSSSQLHPSAWAHGEPAVVACPPAVLGPPDPSRLSLERRVSVTSSALQALDALTLVLQNSITATQTHRTSVPNGQILPASALGNSPGGTPLSSPHQQSVAAQSPVSLIPATSVGQTSTAVSTPVGSLPLSAVSRSTGVSQCVLTGQLAERSQKSPFSPSLPSNSVGNCANFSPGDESAHRRLPISGQVNTPHGSRAAAYSPADSLLRAATIGETAQEMSPTALERDGGSQTAAGGLVAGSGSFHSEPMTTASTPQQPSCTSPHVSTVSSMECSPAGPTSVGVENGQTPVTSDPVTTPPSAPSTAVPSGHVASSVQGGGAILGVTNSTSGSELTGSDIGLVISSVCSLARNGSPEGDSGDSRLEVQDTNCKADDRPREPKSFDSSKITCSTPEPVDTSRTVQQQATSGRDQGLPFLRFQGSPSISLCFPVVGWNGQTVPGPVIGVAATPVELVHPPSHGHIGRSVGGSPRDRSGADGTTQKVKRRHGGGWPKGKRRKVLTEPQPPKPPATGYALFLAEKRPSLQRELGSNSMSLLSKALGKQWASLPKEEREGFYARAETDRRRYLEELRRYLTQVHGEKSGDNLEKLDTFLNHSFASEADDDVLMCQMCQITFHCLHNKRTHYSGKLHTDALLEQLNRLLGTAPKTKSKARGRQGVSKPSSHTQDSQTRITNGRPAGSPDTEGEPVGSERSAAEEGVQEGSERSRLDAGERAASLGMCVEQDVAPTHLALGKLASSDAPGRGERTMHTSGDTATGTLVEVGVAPVEVGVAQRASSPATTGAQDSPMEEEGACPGTGHRKSLHDRLPSLLRDLASSYEAVTADLRKQEEKRAELMGTLAGLHQQCEQLEFMDEGLSRELAGLQEEEQQLQKQILQLTQLFDFMSSDV